MRLHETLLIILVVLSLVGAGLIYADESEAESVPREELSLLDPRFQQAREDVEKICTDIGLKLREVRFDQTLAGEVTGIGVICH